MMNRRSIASVTLLLTLGLVPNACPAQGPTGRDQPDSTIDAATRKRVVEGIIKHLDEAYVFPETATAMGAKLRHALEAGEFDDVTSAKAFANDLTDRLQGVSKDKHLRIRYSHEPAPTQPPPGREPGSRERDAMRRQGDRINYGFEKLERLEGNVGYLELRGFFPATFGGETAAAAMTWLANADALIIDLRRNGGGAPDMVAFVCSYLFDAEPVHLNDLYFRPDDSTHQWWTLPHVPGKRFGKSKPVYVLTSKTTFSAAEEFTYNLKSLKRATIVGETTGGGAHPGGVRRLDDHFSMFVPSGRAINPTTKTNWEGTGVAPDLAVPADQALKAAHRDALEKLLSASEGDASDEKQRRDELRRLADKLKTELEEAKAGR